MKTFSIKGAYKQGWEWWKQNKKVVTIATFVMLVFSFAADMFDDDFSDIGLLIVVASFYIDMGWWKLLLKVTQKEKVRVRDLIDHGRLIWRYTGVVILTLLIAFGGFILLIIPGIYFLLKYSFATAVVLDKDVSVMEALRESARITEGVKWKLLGLGFISILVYLLGLLALGVGLLVAFPVAGLAYLAVYRKLLERVVEVPQVEIAEARQLE